MSAQGKVSLLQKVKSGITVGPQLITVGGIPGVGKTTFAGQFPKPIFADLENGSSHLNIHRLTPDELPDYEAVKSLVDDLIIDRNGFQTLVIDSHTKLEAYIERYLCGDKIKSIEDYGGGFGKGYVALREELQRFMEKLIKLTTLGMDVIIVAHVQVKKFTDPYDNQTYDRFVLQGNEKATQILMAMSYNVFFCKRVVNTHIDQKTKKTQAFSDGTRVMVTEWAPGADAKNRLNMPAVVEMSYAGYKAAIGANLKQNPQEIIDQIKELCARCDAETVATAKERVNEANGDIEKLLAIKAKVTEVAKV